MNEKITEDGIKYLIARLLERAKEAKQEYKESVSKDDKLFQSGRNSAYYEMLDILKSELSIREQDLKEWGLDINLEREII